MKTSRLLVAVLLASVAPLAARAEESAIRTVTLSSGGLAEVVRSAPSAAGKVEIEVPLEQVDDVLKSLVVIGGGGRVKQLSLGGEAPVEEVMRRMPFSADDLASLPTLLARLQGVSVVAEGGGRSIEGTVLGVGVSRGENGAETQVLSLMGKDGSTASVPLTAEITVRVLDPQVLAKIGEAAAAIGRAKADGSRRIEIVVDAPAGTSAATVDLAYVVAAPIWKTAYRVVAGADGKARLQAWAVVENATGEDWKQVRLTLASGSPVTLKQRLFERYWRSRPEVPVDVAGAPLPRPDDGDIASKSLGAQYRTMPAAAAPPSPARAMAEFGAPEGGAVYDAVAAADAATATESDVSASFAVPGAVDLKAGETLSVPIVDAEVKAERVSLFQQGVSGNHPVAAMLVANDTQASLPPGILTIYGESDGYLGDAQLLGMPAGDSRMVSFAVDRKVTVDRDQRPERSIVRIKVADGILTADVRSRSRTVYTIAGAKDGDRDVVIEHPRMAGWEFSSSAPTTMTDTAYRLKAHVAAGGTAKVEAVDERLEGETMALTDADPDALLSFASEAETDAARASLTALADARRKMVETQTALSDNEQARGRIGEEQARIRQNLQAVPEASALAKRYLTALDEQEGQLAEIDARRQSLDAEFKERRAALEDVIRGL